MEKRQLGNLASEHGTKQDTLRCLEDEKLSFDGDDVLLGYIG